MDKLVPIVVLIILVLVIAIIIIKTLKKNNTKQDKENFNVNPVAKAEILNLDNLLDAFKNPNGITEMVASSSLEEGIKSIQSSINTMNSEIENLKKKEQLPKGSIMLWYNKETPNKNWVLCDGAVYSVKYPNEKDRVDVKVPDFIGKFIKGVGSDASEFKFGGSDKISADNLPVHSHIVEEKTGLTTNKDGDHEHRITVDREWAHNNSQPHEYWAVKGNNKLYDNGSFENDFKNQYGHSNHKHTIPNHKHTIIPSINNKTTAQHEQQKFEPKYREAKFIYYLGNSLDKPIRRTYS